MSANDSGHFGLSQCIGILVPEATLPNGLSPTIPLVLGITPRTDLLGHCAADALSQHSLLAIHDQLTHCWTEVRGFVGPSCLLVRGQPQLCSHTQLHVGRCHLHNSVTLALHHLYSLHSWFHACHICLPWKPFPSDESRMKPVFKVLLY